MDVADWQTSENLQSVRRVMYVKLNRSQTRSDVCRRDDHFQVSDEDDWPQTSEQHQQQMRKQQQMHRQQIRRIDRQISNIKDQQHNLWSQIQHKQRIVEQAQPMMLQTKCRQIRVSSKLNELRQKEANSETEQQIKQLQVQLQILREKVKVNRQKRNQQLASWKQAINKSSNLTDKQHQKRIHMQELRLRTDNIETYLQIRATVRRRQYFPDFE